MAGINCAAYAKEYAEIDLPVERKSHIYMDISSGYSKDASVPLEAALSIN